MLMRNQFLLSRKMALVVYESMYTNKHAYLASYFGKLKRFTGAGGPAQRCQGFTTAPIQSQPELQR
jgi:hypothetical protein